MVEGFSKSPPNPFLVHFAERERQRGSRRLLDIGCGASRNALPLARAGWEVFAVDLSLAMLHAAVQRAATEPVAGRVHFALAAMNAIPARDGTFDLVVAHGIWNLARSSREFRQAVREAARVGRPGGALFVFTFSRNTLPPDAMPVAGEEFVFTQFSGEPQCFLTADQLIAELRDAGFVRDLQFPLQEHNLPKPGAIGTGNVPVIYEGIFRRDPDGPRALAE